MPATPQDGPAAEPEIAARTASRAGPVLRRMTDRAAETLAVGRSGALAEPVAIMLGKVSRRVLGLPSTASDIAVVDLDLSRVPGAIPRGALTIVARLGTAPRGLIAIDPGVAAALAEYRLTGLLAARSGRARLVTEIDAELLRDLIDAVLDGLAGLTPGGQPALRHDHHLADIRALPYILPPEPLQGLQVQLSLGEGETAGPAMILLPAGYLTGGATEPARQTRPGAWRAQFRNAVEAAPVSLDGVLHRWRMPLDALRRLAPGDRLELPRETIGAVSLVAGGRLPVLTGRLGQARGQRAVRIGPGDPATLEEG